MCINSCNSILQVAGSNLKEANFYEDENIFYKYPKPAEGDYPTVVNSSESLSEESSSFIYATLKSGESENTNRNYKCEVISNGDMKGSGTASVTFTAKGMLKQ